MLSSKEVAERLGVTVKTVTNLIKDGQLNGYKIGKLYKVEESDLIDFINKNKITKGE